MKLVQWIRRRRLPADPPIRDHTTINTLINRLLILERVHGPDARVAIAGEWGSELYAVSVDSEKVHGEMTLVFRGETDRKSPIGSYKYGWVP